MFLDGQAIALRLEKKIRKHSQTIRCRLKELQHISKRLSDLGMENDQAFLTFSDVTSGLLLVDFSIDTTACPDEIPGVVKHDLIENHHLINRCEEEQEMVQKEMLNVLQFFIKDIDDLQNCFSRDYLSDGEKCLIGKTLTGQKIKFSMLLENFREFIDINLLEDDLSSYAIQNELGDLYYVNESTEDSDYDESDIESDSEGIDDDIE